MTKEQHKVLREKMNDGKGLWVGSFLRPDCCGPSKHPLGPFLGPSPHMTLEFLGKNRTTADLNAFVQAIEETIRSLAFDSDFSGELTGVGVLWHGPKQTTIALVNSYDVLAFKSRLRREMLDHDLEPDTRYGFIPHVSLVQDVTPRFIFDSQYSSTSSKAGKTVLEAQSVKVNLSDIRLVCGSVEVPMNGELTPSWDWYDGE